MSISPLPLFQTGIEPTAARGVQLLQGVYIQKINIFNY